LTRSSGVTGWTGRETSYTIGMKTAVWAGAPGNVLLSSKTTGLPKDSVANVSQITALDRSILTERIGRLGPKPRAQILHGIDIVLGR